MGRHAGRAGVTQSAAPARMPAVGAQPTSRRGYPLVAARCGDPRHAVQDAADGRGVESSWTPISGQLSSSF
jgi:hypothetical protein